MIALPRCSATTLVVMYIDCRGLVTGAVIKLQSIRTNTSVATLQRPESAILFEKYRTALNNSVVAEENKLNASSTHFETAASLPLRRYARTSHWVGEEWDYFENSNHSK